MQQISSHSQATLTKPRKENRRNPRTSLICPNTGSTIPLRWAYTALPSGVAHRALICSAALASAGSIAAATAADSVALFDLRRGGT